MALGVYHHWSSKRARKRAALAPPPPPGDASVPPDTEIDAQPSRMSAGSITVIAILFMFVIAIIVAILVKVLTTKNSAGMWGVGIGAVAIVVAVVLASMAFSSATKTRKTAPDNNDPHPVPPPKSSNWGLMGVLIVIAILAVAGGIILPKMNGVASGKGVGIQPGEWWTFEQVDPQDTFEVAVEERSPVRFNFTIQKRNDAGTLVNIGGVKLDLRGKRWVGTWVNFLNDGGPGQIFLDQVTPNVWTGEYTLRDKSHVNCHLKRFERKEEEKEVSKPKK